MNNAKPKQKRSLKMTLLIGAVVACLACIVLSMVAGGISMGLKSAWLLPTDTPVPTASPTLKPATTSTEAVVPTATLPLSTASTPTVAAMLTATPEPTNAPAPTPMPEPSATAETTALPPPTTAATAAPVGATQTSTPVPPGYISQTTFVGQWPFIVSEGVLSCHPDLSRAVTFSTGSVSYAINLPAKGAKRFGNAADISKPNANYADVIAAGLKLCK